MKATESERVLPMAIGNEEETMLLVGPQEGPYSKFGEAVDFVANYRNYLPENLKYADEYSSLSNKSKRTFLQNGGLVYNGGTMSENSGNLERVTAECSQPSELAACVQSNEDLLVTMLRSYVQKRRMSGVKTTARAQRRSIDARGSTRGCHDNFEIRDPDVWSNFSNTRDAEVLAHYLATRSFITGAGHVDDTGFHFAQKAQSVTKLEDYGYFSSAYRISLKDDTAYNHHGGRVEIRCSDINISPWAVQARIGGSALLLTMLKTPLAEELKDSDPTHVVSSGARIKHFRRYNRATFTPEFELQSTRNLLHALDYQERIWDLADSYLAKYVDIPEEYETIVHELQYYCQDFRQVLKGRLDVSVLANRSDNAAKFARIISTTRKVNEGATTRPLNTIFARAYDMAYDIIEVSAGSSPTTPRVTKGYGYRLRDKGNFRLPLKPRVVENAFYHPPQTTRAALRGQVIREGRAEAVTWSGVYSTERFQFRSLGPVLRDESNVDLEMLGIV